MRHASATRPTHEKELEAWMQRAKRGDRAAMDRLYERLLPVASSHLRRRMGPGARRWVRVECLASDVVCETLLGLHGLSDEATMHDLVARLFRIARSRLWDVLRKHGDERGESGVERREPLAREDSTDSVARRDDARLLRELVSRLGDAQREAVRLCGLEGKGYAEAGLALGLKPDTVRKRYRSGLVRLAQLLAGREP